MFAAVCKVCIAMAAMGSVQALGARQADDLEAKEQFTVCLYDYAGLSDQTLTKSEIEVNRIFRHAGVGLFWFRWGGRKSDAIPPIICGGSPEDYGLVLKLIPEKMAERFHPISKELGFAAGTQAWVFVDRVRALSESHDFFIVLGDVMAHELGHLLLGPGHSATGIMRASYGSNTLLNAEFGWLLFTPKQARDLRKLALQTASKPSDSTILRSSLPQTSPDRQSAPALPESSQALVPSDARPHAGR